MPTSLTTNTSLPQPYHTGFHLFPKLAPELRIKIWNAIDEPRIVTVESPFDGRKKTYKLVEDIFPVIMHICQESREEGRKRYETPFLTPWADNLVYFDFGKDTLSIERYTSPSQRQFFFNKNPSDLARLERLEIWTRIMWRCGIDAKDGALVGLKEIILVNTSWGKWRCGDHDGSKGFFDCRSHNGVSSMALYEGLMEHTKTAESALEYSMWFLANMGPAIYGKDTPIRTKFLSTGKEDDSEKSTRVLDEHHFAICDTHDWH